MNTKVKPAWAMLGETATRILGMIVCRRENGAQPPSIRELRDATGCKSLNAIACHLDRLRRLGLVDWDKCKARTLRPLVRFVFYERNQ